AGDGTVYFVVRNALLYAVSAATGEIRWAHPLQLPGDTSVPSIAADGTIFVATVAGFATSRVAMLEAVTPSGDSKWSTELASGAAIAPCQVGGPQVALDANGNAFVSFNGNCSDVTAAPLLFGVTAAGAVTWSVDGFISATAIVGAADTLYAFGDLLGTQRGQAVHLFSITSR
ncbi:MAG TPA: PQQ-binding-like beta-propeller repeat protein, partial [Vicinamibacterales bacterium]|nr:PQQ-binding-like beta-propeller repeat protein [Vicinamibacterales bacterium]